MDVFNSVLSVLKIKEKAKHEVLYFRCVIGDSSNPYRGVHVLKRLSKYIESNIL